MKILALVFLTMFLTGIACAQPASHSGVASNSSVSVIETSWRKEVFIPALYDDPMRVNQDRDDLERDRKATTAENSTRAKQGQTALPPPTKKIASNTPVGSTPMGVPLGDEPAGNRNLPAQQESGTSSVYYVYKARVKNTGAKDIHTVRWQYLLSDQATGDVVGSHSFTTPVNLRVGKSLDLIGKSRTAPARVVDARYTDKDLRKRYVERVIIEAIEYADGQTWFAAP
jgi:hypothetical protein